LRNHISTILSIPPETFVLKYLDNEGDRITMTSNEDMALALSLSDKLLRLVVDLPQAVPLQQQQQFSPISNFPGAPLQQSFPPQQFSQQFPQQQSYSGYGHRPHHHGGGRGGYFQGGGREIAKARILSKIEMLKQNLAQIPPEEQSNRKQHFQMKIHQLEGKLMRFDTMQERKLMKHQQKTEKKWDKRIDPQTLNQIQVLKGQVLSLKHSMAQIKEQKRAKKNELQVCLQTATGDKEAIWKELLTLKESGHEIGKQIAALKDQIRALRGF